jgi:hypothetical protein
MLYLSPFAWWPVNKLGLANNITPGYRSPRTGIIAVVTVISKNKVLAVAHCLGPEVFIGSGWFWKDIGFIYGSIIDENLAIFYLYGLTREGNNPLDEWVLRTDALAWVEHDYISSFGVREVITCLIYYDPIAIFNAW